MKFIIFCTNLHFFIFLPSSRLQLLACFQILILHSLIINNLPAIFHNIFPKASVLLIQVLYHKKALPNRQCTSFHTTGYHFTGPVALRPRLSSGLPISLLFLNFCKKTGFIILWFSTVYKKNITVLTPENQKRTADTYTRTVLLLSKSTKH